MYHLLPKALKLWIFVYDRPLKVKVNVFSPNNITAPHEYLKGEVLILRKLKKSLFTILLFIFFMITFSME